MQIQVKKRIAPYKKDCDSRRGDDQRDVQLVTERVADALVIGYIDACQEVMGEMYYDNSNEHYFIPGPPVQFDAIEMSNIPEINYSLYLNSLLPYQTVSTGGGEPNYIWAPAYCVDCRRNGGTKHKPADWPRD